jgi:peroxiredoxin
MDTLININQPAPEFQLTDLDGQYHSLAEYRGRLIILNFWSAECPWSKRADMGLTTALAGLRNQVTLLTIAANPHEEPDQIRQTAGEHGLPVVLLDPQQHTARSYGAITTPHIFVIDEKGLLRYQGAYDDVTFRQREPTRAYVWDAVNALLENRQPNPATTPPYGCTIVYNEVH